MLTISESYFKANSFGRGATGLIWGVEPGTILQHFVIIMMQGEEEACPLCKSDHYLNPKMRFKVSPCFHKICDGCVDRLFSSGSGPCPICGTSLRKGHWVIPTFEDVLVERECGVRKRLARIFCRTADEFIDLRAYNDYLEEIEDIVFNLVHDQDVQQMEAKLEAYRLANQDQIKKSLQKQTEEEELVKAELSAELARRRRAQEQALQDLQQDAQATKEQQESFLKALETSNESAMEIQGRLAKQGKQLRTVSSAARVVSIEDELPSLRGLKQRKGPNRFTRSENNVHVDPLETVPLLSLPEALCAPSELATEQFLLFDSIDPFSMGSEADRIIAAGYSKAWLLKACWESAFSYGLV